MLVFHYVASTTWWKELTHWKRPWYWERLKAGEEGDDRWWDGWMASLTQWTWVWVNSGSWWWTERPDVLQSLGLPRVRHDSAIEQQHLSKENMRFLNRRLNFIHYDPNGFRHNWCDPFFPQKAGLQFIRDSLSFHSSEHTSQCLLSKESFRRLRSRKEWALGGDILRGSLKRSA